MLDLRPARTYDRLATIVVGMFVSGVSAGVGFRRAYRHRGWRWGESGRPPPLARRQPGAPNVPEAQDISKDSSMKIYAVFAYRSDGVVVSLAPCTSHDAIAAIRKFRSDGCSSISIYRNARSIDESELRISAEGPPGT